MEPQETASSIVREAARLGASAHLLVRVACFCARAVHDRALPEQYNAYDHALATAERWTRGESTRQECLEATRLASFTVAGACAEAAWHAACARILDSHEKSIKATSMAVIWQSWAMVSEDSPTVLSSVRALLTHDVMAELSRSYAERRVRKKVLGHNTSKRRLAIWTETVESGALHSVLTAWAEVETSDRDDKSKMLRGIELQLKTNWKKMTARER